jgi:hypothetical protein
MLMLIDTPDPRYRPEPEPEREPWRRRHPRARVALPLGDGALAMLPTGDGLWSNRQ